MSNVLQLKKTLSICYTLHFECRTLLCKGILTLSQQFTNTQQLNEIKMITMTIY